MSTDKRVVLSRIAPGTGVAVDLGGGRAELEAPLEALGYRYVNIDVVARPSGDRAVRGDAARLPFGTGTVDLVVSNDSLEHFTDPNVAVGEVRRVLAPAGRFVVLVPFLHPFHGDDYFRYTPIALDRMFEGEGLEVLSLEAPLWIFSVLSQITIVLLKRAGLGRAEPKVEAVGRWLDGKLVRWQGKSMAYAAAYLMVARPSEPAGVPTPAQ